MEATLEVVEAYERWAEGGAKRARDRHVGRGLSRRSALAAAREFVQLRKHKTTSPDRFSFPI